MKKETHDDALYSTFLQRILSDFSISIKSTAFISFFHLEIKVFPPVLIFYVCIYVYVQLFFHKLYIEVPKFNSLILYTLPLPMLIKKVNFSFPNNRISLLTGSTASRLACFLFGDRMDVEEEGIQKVKGASHCPYLFHSPCNFFLLS